VIPQKDREEGQPRFEGEGQVRKRDLKHEGKQGLNRNPYAYNDDDDSMSEDEKIDLNLVMSLEEKPASKKSAHSHEAEGAFEGYPEITCQTIQSLQKRGIKNLFPIQQECFYPIYEDHDIIGRDLTGSGKTLAFALPLIERFRAQRLLGSRKVQAIVLAPTRELAV